MGLNEFFFEKFAFRPMIRRRTPMGLDFFLNMTHLRQIEQCQSPKRVLSFDKLVWIADSKVNTHSHTQNKTNKRCANSEKSFPSLDLEDENHNTS
jgi:hypothetical protein